MAQIPRTDKSEIKELNTLEVRGYTIDRLVQIEYKINQLILEFFAPNNPSIFNKVVLNNSILDIGGKLKILKNIGVNSSLIENIRKLISIRNGFAHSPMLVGAKLIFDPDNKPVSHEVNTIINVMNAQGIIKSKNASEWLAEFHDLYERIIHELNKELI